MPTILLTSFQTWQSHQISNSSDDLLEVLNQRKLLDDQVHLLRNIIVDFELAPASAIATFNQLQPEVIICCGMAENRRMLSVESNGKFQTETLSTQLDLRKLSEGTTTTQISHDAGNFVCNHLYYSILKYIRENTFKTHCLFIHVPILTEENLDLIIHDFLIIMRNISEARLLVE